MSTETRLVRSSRPLPQAPCTGVADASRAPSTAALSPAEEPPPEAGPWAPWVSADDGSSSTVSQPDPVVVTSGLAWSLAPPGGPPDRFTWVTVAPGGGVNVRSAGAGLTKWISVYPTWKAGLLAPRAKTCRRSGTPLLPSTSICTWPISDPASLGARTSAYAACPATVTLLATRTVVVGPTAASTCWAACCGVSGCLGKVSFSAACAGLGR